MSGLIEELLVYGDLLQGVDFTAVALHPLSDEVDTLNRLKMSQSDCRICDLYWLFKDMIFFVSIVCSDKQKPMVTYHWKTSVGHGHSFYVVTNRGPLDTSMVNVALRYLTDWVVKHEKILCERSARVVHVTNVDIFEKAIALR
jgi:hypothetical protein